MIYYYKKKLPSIDDVVIAKVKNISEYGIEVSLVEYNGATGFINCSEVSRKKKVNFNKLLTIGKDILVHVIQVDELKHMIDLSKRTISDDDVKLFTDTHRSHIQLYNLFKQLYMKIYDIGIEKISQEELHKFLCLTLFEVQTEFENEYLIEKLINKETNNEIIETIDFDSIEGIEKEQFKSILDEYIDKKINRTKPELTETIKLMTYSATGVADIKYTLDFKSFENYNELIKDFEVKINYMTGSAYSIIIIQKDFDLKGNKTIENVNNFIKQEIKKRATEKQIQNQIVI
jgi:translation initiation factor 2 alpha subunit (eIF-2alpha)